MVEDDLGRLGRVWRETDTETTNIETVISDLLTSQYKNPLRVIAFNLAEGWSRDVSGDVADELRRRCDTQGLEIPASIAEFIERNAGAEVLQMLLGPPPLWSA
jgi:hypothetical protein